MGKIRIVTDSTCDLSKDLIEENEITVMPLCIVMDDKSYYDGVDVTPDQIYEWADRNKTTPKTAAITFEKATEILKPMAEAGDDIIFIGISEQMSTTCNIIRMLRDEWKYPHLYSVDSMNLSTGIGIQVLGAVKMVREGLTAEEIVKRLEERRTRVRTSFVIDTLTYLARGGRCNAVTALLANTLQLKPRIFVKDGAMGVGKKYRGKMQSVLLKYARDMEEDLLHAEKERVFITHSGCSKETVETVREYLESLNHFENITETVAGGVISSHCGPNTLGILFVMEK